MIGAWSGVALSRVPTHAQDEHTLHGGVLHTKNVSFSYWFHKLQHSRHESDKLCLRNAIIFKCQINPGSDSLSFCLGFFGGLVLVFGFGVFWVCCFLGTLWFCCLFVWGFRRVLFGFFCLGFFCVCMCGFLCGFVCLLGGFFVVFFFNSVSSSCFQDKNHLENLNVRINKYFQGYLKH